MAYSIKDKAAVVGMGCSKFGERFDASKEDLLLEAMNEALEDAGIGFEDIDAYWFGTFETALSGDGLSSIIQSEYKPVTRVENKCCTGSDAFRNACYAVISGAYDVVMAVGVEKLKDSGYSGIVNPVSLCEDFAELEVTAPTMFELLAPAYAAKYGVSYENLRETLNHIAYKNHYNGSMNPKALYRKEVPLETLRKSPMISAPYLTVMDCSGVSDGAACAIIMRTEDALKHRKDPMFIKASDLAVGPLRNKASQEYEFLSITETAFLAKKMYKELGITDPAKQIDVAEIHDCFTITELVLYEDLMLSERGHGWRDALDGKFDRTGSTPVNIDGGLKAFGHPLGASGMRMLYECWLQFHGKAGKRQLDNPKLGLAHNLGGTPWICTTAMTFVGSELG